MRQRSRRDRRRLLLHVDSMYSTFRYLSSLPFHSHPERSEGPAFASAAKQQVLRFAQDDNLMYGVARTSIDPDPAANAIPAPKARTAARTPPRSSAGSAPRLRRLPTGGRTREKAEES